MARRVTSLVRTSAGALRANEPALEANAFAVAEDVHLTVVLAGPGVELALAGGEIRPGGLAGVALPPAAPGQDLRGLVESGVAVLVAASELERRGLVPEDLAEGVRAVDDGEVAQALLDAEAVVSW